MHNLQLPNTNACAYRTPYGGLMASFFFKRPYMSSSLTFRCISLTMPSILRANMNGVLGQKLAYSCLSSFQKKLSFWTGLSTRFACTG